MTSSSFEGNTHVENLKTPGYRSARSYKMYVPRPEPVPPPIEWRKKKPCRLSHCSTAVLTRSSISSLYIGPYEWWPHAQLFPAPELSLMHYRDSKMSLSSPFKILFSITPLSISTTMARAFRSLIIVPVYRSIYPFFLESTLRKKLLRASS